MESHLTITSEPLKLMTAREAARCLRVSLSTLNPLRIPGGRRRYTVDMLNECLRGNFAGRGDLENVAQDTEAASLPKA